VLAFATNYLIVKSLWHFKDKVNFTLSTFLFFTIYYFQTYNITRQWLAIAIVFFAIKYLFSNKYIKYLLIVLVASTIHSSAIITLSFIPLHVWVTRKLSKKYKFFIFLLLFTMFIFGDRI